MGDAVKQTGEFVGRCDSCGDAIYDYQDHYLVTVGKQNLMLCPCCCIRVSRKRPPMTRGAIVREYDDVEFADFLTCSTSDQCRFYIGWMVGEIDGGEGNGKD